MTSETLRPQYWDLLALKFYAMWLTMRFVAMPVAISLAPAPVRSVPLDAIFWVSFVAMVVLRLVSLAVTFSALMAAGLDRLVFLKMISLGKHGFH